MNDFPSLHWERKPLGERTDNVVLTSTSPSNTVTVSENIISVSVCLSAVPVIHWKKTVISCSFPCINIHAVLCIDRLWLNVGVERAEYWADPPAFFSKLIWDL